jgi:hypothetical protein
MDWAKSGNPEAIRTVKTSEIMNLFISTSNITNITEKAGKYKGGMA